MKADREIKVRCSACGHLTRIPTVTHADHIRAMTDDELAEFITYRQGLTPHHEHFEGTKLLWLDWLKEEVDDG